MLEEHESFIRARFSTRKSTIDLRGGAVVLDRDRAVARAGGAPTPSTTVCEPASPTASAVEAEVGSVSISSGFFFAPIIPFSDVYRGSLIASLTATTAGSGTSMTSLPNSVSRTTRTVPSLDGELRRLRHERQPQPVRDRGPEDGAATVARLLAEQHEVGALALERRGQHPARRDQVGAGRRRGRHEHRTVGAHRQRRAQRLRRRGRAHRQMTTSAPQTPSAAAASSIAFLSTSFSSPGPLRSRRTNRVDPRRRPERASHTPRPSWAR